MLVELSSPKKNKISLQDYDYRHDIEHRLLLAEFSVKDVQILEEILYSSLHIPIETLLENLSLTEEELRPTLQKLERASLLSMTKTTITVDKEKRKHFESHLLKFDPDFKPNMEFLQHLLKKVPIHVLPSWYAIPRTSNNIFNSLLEKYLASPVIFQRHFSEMSSTDPLLGKIAEEVFHSPELYVYADTLMEKFHLSHEAFEEALLSLEFHFICCLSYRKEEGHWREIVTPFHEWKEYLTFLHAKAIPSIPSSATIVRFRPRDFAFVEDAYRVLSSAHKKNFAVSEELLPEPSVLKQLCAQIGHFQEEDPAFLSYLQRIIAKLESLKFVERRSGLLTVLSPAHTWLELESEARALFLHRHPLNHPELHAPGLDKSLREVEKSIALVLDAGWVYLDAFAQGVRAPLSAASTIRLERQGKTWRYHLPEYTSEETLMIKNTIFDFLFEVGITAIGTHEGRECFCVTPFGKSLFG